DVRGLHARRILLLVAAERRDDLDTGDAREISDDPDAEVFAGHRPGAGVQEDVLPGSADLRPPSETRPAGMDAADGGSLEPHRFHGSEIPRFERAIKAQVRGRDRSLFGRHAASTARATRSRSTLPPETIATARAPGASLTFPSSRAAVAAAPEAST